MDSGTKVVGARVADTGPKEAAGGAATEAAGDAAGDTAGDGDAPSPPRRAPRARPRPSGGGRRSTLILTVSSVLGLIGTVVFALLWATGGGSSQDPAVLSAARTFLTDLTNFNAKTVDSDFSAVTAMATGSFASQANQFFNSAIRTDLEKALAESRGQIRGLYIQSDSGNAATVYGVVDQLYVNNKITTPQSDVLRILVDLQSVGSTWKISNVTVLEGATPASEGTSSGSSGSSVPGQ